MELSQLYRKLSHKVAQLQRAETRVANDPSAFNLNNYYTTQRALHALALELTELTK